MQNDLTRPIIGIENRTAQEVFDIMCDRFRHLSATVPAGDGELVERVKALEEALRPFARCSEVYPNAKADAEAAFGCLYDPRCPLTIGDFHAARATLQKEQADG